MTHEDLKVEVVATSTTWDDVFQRWAEIERTRAWFAQHRWVIAPADVFTWSDVRRKPFPPAEFGEISDPENNFDRLVELARACGWERQDRLMYTLD